MSYPRIFILLLVILALPGCTVLGLAMDTKMCGEYRDNQNNHFGMAHNTSEQADEGCKPLFTPLGLYLDLQIIKSFKNAGKTKDADYYTSKKLAHNEYSGNSCPGDKKKICFVEKGCQCVRDI